MQHTLDKLGFLHGCDYNPDQWLDRPDILDKDIEYMKKAHINCVSLGIFSWSRLEPRDGLYDLDWLENVIDRLYQNGIYTVLATPSGARPAWMAQAHPEVLRVNEHFQKMHFGERHNHCPSSPYYRQKVRDMDERLSARFANHPAVILWHISNEFSGTCYCEHCQQEFRSWLQNKYSTLEELNKCWCTDVWSQRYSAWEQIEPPSPEGEISCVSMRVDWQRFSSDQCKSFIRLEKEALKKYNPSLPVTVNMMERFWDYDYFSLAEQVDIVSWDCYPPWKGGNETAVACEYAMNHDIMRSLKKRPFLMMESTPSKVNWHSVNKLKKPGMHKTSSLQAIAHGSQSVQYFQWRKCRGGPEAFHGAVIGHDGSCDTRVFRDVEEVGQALTRLGDILNEEIHARVCIVYDAECRWAVDFAQTGTRANMKYFDTVLRHYSAFRKMGIHCDFADMREGTDLSGYDLVICPMLFMFRNDFHRKLRAFTQNGGTLVMTYLSGICDEFDLAFNAQVPYGLTDVLGICESELDALYPDEKNSCLYDGKRYDITGLCALTDQVHATVLSAYEKDFYASQPVLTKNSYGKGTAYYIAANVSDEFLMHFYDNVAQRMQLKEHLPFPVPEGVFVTVRGSAIFLQNYSGTAQTIALPEEYCDVLSGSTFQKVVLPENGCCVLKAQSPVIKS